MDITTITWLATTTFALLKPFLSKSSESIYSEIWKSIYNKIKETFSNNWKIDTINNLEKWINDLDIWKAQAQLEWFLEKDKELLNFLKENLPKLEQEIKISNKNTNVNNSNIAINLTSSENNDNLALTKEILNNIGKTSKKNTYLSTIIAWILFSLSIWFVIYWIILYPEIIFSWNNIVYIFWIPFIWWFLLLFLNTYFVNQELSFEKIKWEIEIEKQKEEIEILGIVNDNNFLQLLNEYLKNKWYISKNDYLDRKKEVWFNKNWKRIFEFIYRINYVQIAVSQDENFKTLMWNLANKIWVRLDTFWTSYYLVKIPYNKLDWALVQDIEKIIDETLK